MGSLARTKFTARLSLALRNHEPLPGVATGASSGSAYCLSRAAWSYLPSEDLAMQNDRTPPRQFKPGARPTSRAQRWTPNADRPNTNGAGSAQRSYERYLALAQEEARSGNVVGAENYYQHAEHYYRLMSRDRGEAS